MCSTRMPNFDIESYNPFTMGTWHKVGMMPISKFALGELVTFIPDATSCDDKKNYLDYGHVRYMNKHGVGVQLDDGEVVIFQRNQLLVNSNLHNYLTTLY